MNMIGRLCIVQDLKEHATVFVEGLITSRDAEGRAERIRLQTGQHFGEVRQPGEYELTEFVDPGEAPGVLAAVWAD